MITEISMGHAGEEMTPIEELKKEIMSLCEDEDHVGVGFLNPIADKIEQEISVLKQTVEELAENLQDKIAAATAHRACHSAEHDPANGRLHGYCIVCGIPWPCDTAKAFLYQFNNEKVGRIIREEEKK